MGQTSKKPTSRKRAKPIATTLALVTAFVGMPKLFLPQQSHADDVLETERGIRNVQINSPNTGGLAEADITPDKQENGGTDSPDSSTLGIEDPDETSELEFSPSDLPVLGEIESRIEDAAAEDNVDSGLQWFASPVVGERRLEMAPARFSYNGLRGGVTSYVRGPQANRDLKVKRIRIAFTRTDGQDQRSLEVKNARFVKNGSTCRGRNVTTHSFGNKVVEFDVSRCNVNIWEGSNDELRVEDIALSGGGQVPPDAFAMNAWVDDIFDPGGAREWTKQAENGVLTTLIEPEDHLESSRVQMRRTIERAAKIKGPFVARLQNQNGFDVDGGQEPAELRIIGPQGETIYSKRINANEGHAAALEPGNGWGGIDFKEGREFTVPAGSRVGVDMVLHGRNKHG